MKKVIFSTLFAGHVNEASGEAVPVLRAFIEAIFARFASRGSGGMYRIDDTTNITVMVR